MNVAKLLDVLQYLDIIDTNRFRHHYGDAAKFVLAIRKYEKDWKYEES